MALGILSPRLHPSPVPVSLQSPHSQESAPSPTEEQRWWVPREPQELQSRSLQGLGEQRDPLPPKAPELWAASPGAVLSPPPPCSPPAAGAELPARTLCHARLGIPGNFHFCPEEEAKASSPGWGCGDQGHQHSPLLLHLLPSRRAQALAGVAGAVPLVVVHEGPVLLPGSIPVGAGERSAPGVRGTPRWQPGRQERIRRSITEREGGRREGTNLSGILMPRRNISAWKVSTSWQSGQRKWCRAERSAWPWGRANISISGRGGPIRPPGAERRGDDRGDHVRGRGRCRLPGCSGGGTRRWRRRGRPGCRSRAAPPPPPGR